MGRQTSGARSSKSPLATFPLAVPRFSCHSPYRLTLSFDAKVPGPLERLATVTMKFGYAEYFKE